MGFAQAKPPGSPPHSLQWPGRKTLNKSDILSHQGKTLQECPWHIFKYLEVALVLLHQYNNFLEFHLMLIWRLNRTIKPFSGISGIATGLLHTATEKWQAKYLKLFWWWKNADKLIPQPCHLHYSLFHFKVHKQNWTARYLLQPLFCNVFL